jgi:hypothetical protein
MARFHPSISPRAGARLLYAARLFGIGVIAATTSFGPPLMGARPPGYSKGQASVVIVETATLQNGVVRDAKGRILANGTPKGKKPEKSERNKANSMQRSDNYIVIDLP